MITEPERRQNGRCMSGLVFFAISAYRLQQNVFPGRAAWPVALLAAGMALMIAAANYAPLKVRWMGLATFRKRQVQSAARDIAVP